MMQHGKRHPTLLQPILQMIADADFHKPSL
jgi:hypothetical protein